MPRQALPPLRPSPGRGGGGGDRVWSPWWVTGGADPCAAEVAFGLPPGGLPCSVADGAGPRVVIRCAPAATSACTKRRSAAAQVPADVIEMEGMPPLIVFQGTADSTVRRVNSATGWRPMALLPPARWERAGRRDRASPHGHDASHPPGISPGTAWVPGESLVRGRAQGPRGVGRRWPRSCLVGWFLERVVQRCPRSACIDGDVEVLRRPSIGHCRSGSGQLSGMIPDDRPRPARRLQGQRRKDLVVVVVLTVSPLACPRASSGVRTTGGALPGLTRAAAACSA